MNIHIHLTCKGNTYTCTDYVCVCASAYGFAGRGECEGGGTEHAGGEAGWEQAGFGVWGRVGGKTQFSKRNYSVTSQEFTFKHSTS